MKSHKGNKADSVGRGLRLFLIALFAVGTLATIGMLYFGVNNPQSFKDLGSWGDFFGGTLNPILTFLTLLGVLATIAYQKIELNLTRKELDRSATAQEKQLSALSDQSFENTFFRMLELHNTIVNSIDLVRGDRTTHGRDCFNTFYERLRKHYIAVKNSSPVLDEQIALTNAYNLFWERTQPELGHYFRFLFNVIRFIKRDSLGEEFYIKLLRSQLSNQELLLLFYNCLSLQGAKFKIFAEEFALFDNLPISRLLDPSHKYRFSISAYGNNSEALKNWSSAPKVVTG